MKRAYIYPATSINSTASNPYIDDFKASLTGSVRFLNKSRTSRSGILDIFNYILEIDLLFLHWIEDLPNRKAGTLQSILFVAVILPFCRIRGIRIVYTLHNKESHYSRSQTISRIIRKRVIRQAYLILCHAREGLHLPETAGLGSRIRYLPHPFRESIVPKHASKKTIDILIWGAIQPYKGIHLFLRFLEAKNLLSSFNIRIAGKIEPESYTADLLRYQSGTIQIHNRFIDNEKLNELIDQSKLVLLTYDNRSVLSSGALIYSLSRKARVIGPNTGSFGDLSREGLIEVYDNYDDLLSKISRNLSDPAPYRTKLDAFIENNTWERFGERLSGWLMN
jgi:glycosyltransferase involved in cell wall biosynthesis